ncbi:MAG TPA: aminotransferase class V-fold PLP-dependent enzyme, partial [Caulobacteraceae bacterium]|nr:aminotransferase class V-fold PLP-dependent enzyme [Caulobacteraceae bacterium]
MSQIVRLPAHPGPERPAPPRLLFERAFRHAVRFRKSLSRRPPWPTVEPAELVRRFGGPTPEFGEDGAVVLDWLVHAAEPGLTGAAGPRFFGWVIGASHPVGAAADMLTSAWGQNAGNPAAAPAAAVAEQAVGRWLLDLLRLPPESSVGFVTGATMAGFVGLAAARNAVLRQAGWDVEADGLAGAPKIRVFLGADAHVTILAALRYLGLGSNPVWIDTDAQGRMKPEALTWALAEGEGPAIVVAGAGQINTGAFDPFVEIAQACRAHGAWLHVDGAFGLWARTAPELDALTEGVDLADSWSVDGHKWLQLPYDSGFAIVRDEAAHRRAMAASASYLPAGEGGVPDPSHFAPELSRRARGFAAWAMIRHLGRRGIAGMVRRHCQFARRAAERLAAEPGVRVLNDVVLNQVIVAFGGGPAAARDAATAAVIAELRAANQCLAGGAEWRGRQVLRLSFISHALKPADVDRLTAAVTAAWRRVRARRAAA